MGLRHKTLQPPGVGSQISTQCLQQNWLWHWSTAIILSVALQSSSACHVPCRFTYLEHVAALHESDGHFLLIRHPPPVVQLQQQRGRRRQLRQLLYGLRSRPSGCCESVDMDS